jgi:hypothetical protein
MRRLRTEVLIMMKASATEHYSGTATIEEIEQYLRVKGDKRRELFAY